MHPYKDNVAKLLDDAAKQGKFSPGATEKIIQRIGAAKDAPSEVAKIRSELDIESGEL